MTAPRPDSLVEKRQPWLKWYARDWRGDGALRMCSFGARGLWADLLSVMHDEGEPYGHLRINGRQPTSDQLARMFGGSAREIDRLIAELEGNGVFSRASDGTIYSRRMVRDKEKADRDRNNGKGGGNPKITPPDNPKANRGVNPQDKAQKPEARDQMPDSSSGSSNPRSSIDPPLADPPFALEPDQEPQTAPKSRPAKPENSTEFEAFWQQYPRREARRAAEKAYGQALKRGAAPAEILAGAMRYAAARAGDDPKFTAHASTWLNADRWKDQPPVNGGPHGQGFDSRQQRTDPEADAYRRFLGRSHGGLE